MVRTREEVQGSKGAGRTQVRPRLPATSLSRKFSSMYVTTLAHCLNSAAYCAFLCLFCILLTSMYYLYLEMLVHLYIGESPLLHNIYST